MADSYTSLTRILKMETGSHTDSWGGLTNTNWDLIEAAITGYKQINVAGNSNVSISVADGVADDQRYKILEFVGALTGNINVWLVSAAKEYIVRNSTSGAFTLTLTCSAGSGVVPTQGQNIHIWCDGTTVRPATTKFEAMTVSALTGTSVDVDNIGVSVNISATEVITPKVSATAINVTGIVSVDGAAVLGSTVSVSGAGTFKAGVSVSGALVGTVVKNSGIITLTDAASIAVDLALGNIFVVSLSSTGRTLEFPTNGTGGQCFAIYVVQASASCVLSFPSGYRWENGTTATFSTSLGDVDILAGIMRTAAIADVVVRTNFN